MAREERERREKARREEEESKELILRLQVGRPDFTRYRKRNVIHESLKQNRFSLT